MDLLTLERLLAMWPGDCSLSPHALTSAGGGKRGWMLTSDGAESTSKQTNKQTQQTNNSNKHQELSLLVECDDV